MPANCAEISKVTSGGGNWILRDLGPPEAKAFDRKIQLLYSFMKYDYEKLMKAVLKLHALFTRLNFTRLVINNESTVKPR